MIIILLLTWGAVMILLARLICRCWVSHLSIYSFLWTVSLSLYELHWIRYNSISAEAWIYIFLAWIAIYIGTALATVGDSPVLVDLTDRQLSKIKTLIVLFSLAGLCSCVVLARQIMREVDSNLLVAVTVGAPKIYAAGFEETGEFVGIPYLGFLPFAACGFAGAYLAKRMRFDWVCVLPLLIATATGILSASRWDILLSGALFLLAFYLSPRSKSFRLSRSQKLLLMMAFVGGIIFISVTRLDLTSSLGDQQSTLNTVAKWVPIAPSVYFYVSGPPVGLSEYLHDSDREANLPWGRYTFASIYRFLSKVGLTTYVPFHQDFYGTPEPINTCTYVRELYSDFGVAGPFFAPLVLGSLLGWLSLHRTSLLRTMCLTYGYIVIVFSFSNLVMATGQWVQGVVVAILACLYVDRKGSFRAIRNAMSMPTKAAG